jgi:hypothetical protein
MTKNMGPLDRALRIIIALVIGSYLLAGTLTGVVAIVLGIVGIALVLTSVVGWCPLYVPFHVSTRRPAAQASR